MNCMDVSSQPHAPAILLRVKEPPALQYPLKRRLGGPWSLSGWSGEDRNFPCLKPNYNFS